MLEKLNQIIVSWLEQSNATNFFVRMAKSLYSTILVINDGYLVLHAKSLVYTTLVSLVPVLAISFSLLKYFGVHNQISPLLQNLLSPLGEKGNEIALYIINLIDNVDVGILGIIGTIVLLYTVISTITQIEETLNHIWHAQKPRSWLRRIFYYLSVSFFAPALVFIGLLLTASLTNMSLVQKVISIEPFGMLYLIIAKLIPYFASILAFSLIYKSLPNTHVDISSAIVGGVSATLVWKVVGYGFTIFMNHSVNYDIIYSGFAALILFFLWIYISWLIFLLGGQLAYAYQNPQRL